MRAFLVIALVCAAIVANHLLFEREDATAPPSKAATRTELMRLASEGRTAELRALLDGGADPNQALPDGTVALDLAAREGRLEAVALLLAHGARVRKQGAAATLAGLGEHWDVVRLLLYAGAEFPRETAIDPALYWLSRGPPSAGSPLFHAAIDGDRALAEVLVDAGFTLDEQRTRDGMTPLHAAALGGKVEVVALFLARGADVRSRTTFARTPLHAAALSDDVEVVDSLLAAGADPAARDELGATPLHLAAWCARAGAVRALAQPAARAGCLDARDDYGCTPLLRAVAMGSGACRATLLAAGADLRAASASARTALHIAAELRDHDAYESLLAAGADEGVVDRLGVSPRDLLGDGDAGSSPLELRPGDVLEPGVRAWWDNRYEWESGSDFELLAWSDGVVLFSDLGATLPWTSPKTHRVGRSGSARVERLSTQLVEVGFFDHPPYDGLWELHGTIRSVGCRPPESSVEAKEHVLEVPFEQDFSTLNLRFESETNATLAALWRDVQGILHSVRPAAPEPLEEHLLDKRFGEGTFRGIRWGD